MSDAVKICPSCGDEFQPWVELCPDCHVPLQMGSGESAPDVGSELPPPTELECVATGGPWQTRALAERLQEEGIGCRIDAYPPDTDIDTDGGNVAGRFGQAGRGVNLGVYVTRADQPRAAEIVADARTEELPELDGMEMPEPGSELDACPGCGEPLAADATGCSECGLEFPEFEAEE